MKPHRNPVIALCSVLALVGTSVRGQERVSLTRAVEVVLAADPDVAVARAATQEAEQRVPQARARLLPRVDFTQSWQRGNQPVFVFGSLLGQRQFAAADFALVQLNHPEPITNLRSAFSLEQVLFDGGQGRAGLREAGLTAAAARAGERQIQHDLILSTTRAYGRALRAGGLRRAAESAVAAAEEDVRTAEARRDAGTGTEADLLAMRVYRAQTQARAIEAGSEARIARADLNRLMQAPLDRELVLDEPAVITTASTSLDALVAQALQQRPEIEVAALRRDAGRTLQGRARGELWPQVIAQGGYEWNDGRRGSVAAAWIVGAQVRMNLFSGGATIARVREASHAADRAQAEYARAEAALRMEVLTAFEQLTAARAREAVGRAAVAEASESQRMIRDRFEAGIVPAREVIQAATATLDAEAQRIGAVVDVLIGHAALQHAIGSQEVAP